MKLELELRDQVQIRQYVRPEKVDLVELGKDIYIRQLKYTVIAKKHGISVSTVHRYTKKIIKPPQYEHVQVGIGRAKWKWIKRDKMKIRLELVLENKRWTASEIMWGLARLVDTLDAGTNCSGPVFDKKERLIGRYEIETFQPVQASK